MKKMMRSEVKNTNLKSGAHMYKKVPLQLRGRTVLNQFFAELSDLFPLLRDLIIKSGDNRNSGQILPIFDLKIIESNELF